MTTGPRSISTRFEIQNRRPQWPARNKDDEMDIKKYFVSKETKVRDAIKAIDATGKKLVFIVDEKDRLLGLFTDGDMRRYILRNGDLTAPIGDVMNAKPVVFREGEEDKLYDHMRTTKMLVFPVLNDEGQIVRAVFWDEEDSVTSDDMLPDSLPVVIMAGGMGTRLYPYTKILPKPLIPIGDLPIAEHIIRRFKRFNCRDFYMIVNYKKNMIKAYFNEIEKDYCLSYIEESQFLGTGGGLRLLKDRINSTFFLSNCDIIIDANYASIYRNHKQKGNKITIVSAMKNLTVPYGVLRLDESGRIVEMKEKPEYSFLTNTGLYVIEPDVIDDITPDTFLHMPDIIQQYMDKGEKLGVYPVSEKQWLDMGQIEELESMLKVIGEK
jgi:dTDP-glucose pyrophosphorylase